MLQVEDAFISTIAAVSIILRLAYITSLYSFFCFLDFIATLVFWALSDTSNASLDIVF